MKDVTSTTPITEPLSMPVRGRDWTWRDLFPKGQFKSTSFRMLSMTPILIGSLLLKTLLDNLTSSTPAVSNCPLKLNMVQRELHDLSPKNEPLIVFSISTDGATAHPRIEQGQRHNVRDPVKNESQETLFKSYY